MNGDSTDQAKTQVMSEPVLAGGALKQFRLESLIGQGGMGLVYRAHDSRLHRQVAVKILPSALTSDPERKQRFLIQALDTTGAAGQTMRTPRTPCLDKPCLASLPASAGGAFHA